MIPGVYIVEHKTANADIGPGSPYWRKLTLDAQCSNYMVGARALGHDPKGVIYDVIRKIGIKPRLATPVEERKYTQARSKACAECKKKSPAPLPHVDPKTGAECEPMVRAGDGAQEWVRPSFDGDHATERRVITDPGGQLYANMREHDETLDEFRARCIAEVRDNLGDYFRREPVVRMSDEEVESAYDTWQVAHQIRQSELDNCWPRNDASCEAYSSLCSYFAICAEGVSMHDETRYRSKDDAHAELSDSLQEDAKRRGLRVLSTSSARAYRACPRKYWFSHVMRVEPVVRSLALRVGTLLHAGLEVWWKTVSVEAAIAAMREVAPSNEIDPVELIKAEALMLGYHVRWRRESLDVLGVEVEFTAPLVNPKTSSASRTWQRGGKIDALVRTATA